MSVKESKALIHYHKTHKHKRSIGDGSDYRAIDLVHIQTQWVRDIFNRIAYDCVSEIRKTTDQVVYPEMTALNEWEIGGVQTPHLDTYSRYELEHEEPVDATSPNREWTCILYLNDDFRGGETVFPDLKEDNMFSAEIGSGLVFQGIYHQHGVNRVRRGERWTVSTWYTSNPEKILYPNPVRNLDLDNLSVRFPNAPI